MNPGSLLLGDQAPCPNLPSCEGTDFSRVFLAQPCPSAPHLLRSLARNLPSLSTALAPRREAGREESQNVDVLENLASGLFREHTLGAVWALRPTSHHLPPATGESTALLPEDTSGSLLCDRHAHPMT